MKTEFELGFCNESDYLLLLWGKKSQINTTVTDFKGTISDFYNLYNKNSTFISPVYTFPCGKHKCLHAKSRYK